MAKSNLMLASLLNRKFYDLEVKFGLLPNYIQDNKRSDLLKEGQGNLSGDSGYLKMKQFQRNLKKQLEDLVSQMKNGEKGKPLYQRISNMIRENELFGKSRNDLIYNKLLMSEKVSKEKEDFGDKRKSESATQTRFQRPEQMFEFQKKSTFIKTDIQKSDLKLNTYF